VTTPLKVLTGVEASFNTPLPEVGQQITFARWRVQAPQAQAGMACSGTFTIYSPHRAPKVVDLVVGGRLFITEDIGIGPDFNGALQGAAGPFAMRAATPGGGAQHPQPAGGDPVLGGTDERTGRRRATGLLRRPHERGGSARSPVSARSPSRHRNETALQVLRKR
jgi:hypothetical protein